MQATVLGITQEDIDYSLLATADSQDLELHTSSDLLRQMVGDDDSTDIVEGVMGKLPFHSSISMKGNNIIKVYFYLLTN